MQMNVISQYFSILLSLIMFLWVAKYFYVLWYYRKQKESIHKMEARIAVLKMLLKTKLKRKGSQMMDQYKNDKEFLGRIVSKLEMLLTYNLSRPSDYGDLVDILVSIAEQVDDYEMKKTPTVHLTMVKRMNEQREALMRLSVESADDLKQPLTKSEYGAGAAKDSHRGSGQGVQADPAKAGTEIPQFEAHFDKWLNLFKYDKGNMYIIKEIVESNLNLIERIDIYNSEQENKELHIKKPAEIHLHGFENLKKIVDLDLQKSRLLKEEKNKTKIGQNELESA